MANALGIRTRRPSLGFATATIAACRANLLLAYIREPPLGRGVADEPGGCGARTREGPAIAVVGMRPCRRPVYPCRAGGARASAVSAAPAGRGGAAVLRWKLPAWEAPWLKARGAPFWTDVPMPEGTAGILLSSSAAASSTASAPPGP